MTGGQGGQNTLFILSPNTIMFHKMRESGFQVESPSLGNSLFVRLTRGVWIRGPFPGKSLWYNRRVNIRPYDLIVVVAGFVTTGHYLAWLRKCQPHARIILMYDDPIRKSINPATIPTGCCELRSWDLDDCLAYGIKPIKGFYLADLMQVEKQEPIQDVFFVGKNKGRLPQLLKLEQSFQALGLSTNFHIVADYGFQKLWQQVYHDAIPYSEVRNQVARSRAILDFLQNGQSGVSIRTMECQFNQIKLITNNLRIKDWDFYRRQNIFILGNDNIEDLPSFIRSPYEKIAPEILASYELSNWLTTIQEET